MDRTRRWLSSLRCLEIQESYLCSISKEAVPSPADAGVGFLGRIWGTRSRQAEAESSEAFFLFVVVYLAGWLVLRGHCLR